MILLEEEMPEMVIGDHEDIEVRGAGPVHPGRDGAMGPVGPIGPRGFPGRDGLSTTGGPLTSTGLEYPLHSMQT